MKFKTAGIILAFTLGTAPSVFASLQSQETQIITKLYEKKTGHGINKVEESKIQKAGGNATYGEITPEATSKLIHILNITSKDVFVDLGSGIGKLVMQTCLTSSAKCCHGVELSDTRITKAVQARQELEAINPKAAQRITFTLGDITTENIDQATIVFMCSTCFSDDLMKILTEKLANAKGLEVVVTLRPLTDHPNFKLYGQTELAMTWSEKTPVYFYTRTDKPTRSMANLPTNPPC